MQGLLALAYSTFVFSLRSFLAFVAFLAYCLLCLCTFSYARPCMHCMCLNGNHALLTCLQNPFDQLLSMFLRFDEVS